MRIYRPQLFVLLISCYWFMACQSGKSSLKDTTSKNQTAEEILLSKTTIERLISMQEGIFVLLDSTARQPLIMKSGDSLMLYSKQFGDVNRDGYWMYQKMYMSSLPDAPLSVDFLKINKISRDSFSVEQFSAGEEFNDANIKPEILKKVNFNKLVSIQCDITFVKKGQLEFKGRTPICTIGFEGGASQIFSNNFHITIKGVRLFTTYYKKEGGKNVFASTGHCFLKK